jgi:hypothetical protein
VWGGVGHAAAGPEEGFASHGKVASLHESYDFFDLTLSARSVGRALSHRAFGAILSLVVAVLLRSAPYRYWTWKEGQFSKLLDGIRGGFREKKDYSQSVVDCPGLCFFINVDILMDPSFAALMYCNLDP